MDEKFNLDVIPGCEDISTELDINRQNFEGYLEGRHCPG